MAIKPICDKCKKELNDPGALLFSPPDSSANVRKFHICKGCYDQIKKELEADAE